MDIWGNEHSRQEEEYVQGPKVGACLKCLSLGKQARWLLERKVRVPWGQV